jgi:hypothetical protein
VRLGLDRKQGAGVRDHPVGNSEEFQLAVLDQRHTDQRHVLRQKICQSRSVRRRLGERRDHLVEVATVRHQLLVELVDRVCTREDSAVDLPEGVWAAYEAD